MILDKKVPVLSMARVKGATPGFAVLFLVYSEPNLAGTQKIKNSYTCQHER